MPKFSTRIHATGPDGNVFVVLGAARRMMGQLGVARAEQDQLTNHVLGSGCYEEALTHIREWFPVDAG